MTGRQFIGLCVVIAIFAVFWRLDHGKRHLVPPDETHIPTLVPQKLDPEAVIRITNNYRTAKGLSALKENPQLSQAARLRAEDMIAKNYFSHNCPYTGDGPAEAAQSSGYQHMALAENIAKGNFSSSQKLVLGWMNSKGHRENILNPDMQEIGVAVVRDNKLIPEGLWPKYYGVQLFAVKMPQCNHPDQALSARIVSMQDQHVRMQNRISGMRLELDNIEGRIRREKDRSRANQLIERFNQGASDYNLAVENLRRFSEELSSTVEAYNMQVNAYQACMN